MEPERITARQIEAARRAITAHMKRAGRVWIRVFPDVPVSKKPGRGPHGLGQGRRRVLGRRVKPGRMLFEIDGVPSRVARRPSPWGPPSCRSSTASSRASAARRSA